MKYKYLLLLSINLEHWIFPFLLYNLLLSQSPFSLSLSLFFYIYKAHKRDHFLTICMSLIILCICLRMIFRRRVFIMASLPDHWHNSLSLLFFFSLTTTKKKMREEDAWTINWRARTHTRAYTIWSLSKKRVDGGWAMKTLRMCCFHVYFSRHDFDQNLLSRLSIKNNRRKINIFHWYIIFLIFFSNMIIGRVYSLSGWKKEMTLFILRKEHFVIRTFA